MLNDGSEIPIRFVDDQQFWLEDGSVHWFKKPFQLYNKIDEILMDHVFWLTLEIGANKLMNTA